MGHANVKPIYDAMAESRRQFLLQMKTLDDNFKINMNIMDEQIKQIQEKNKLYEKWEKERLEEKRIKEENEKIFKESIKKLKEKIINETNEASIIFLEKIEKNFDNNKFNWCIEEIEKEDYSNKIKEIFNKLKEEYRIETNLKLMIKNIIKKIQFENVSCYNIQIVGFTGVGKSTLINSIFQENIAEESFGNIGTKETKEYISNKYNFIKFIDTRGSELNDENNINVVLNNTLKYIDDKLSEINPNNTIHCLFYCISGNRFQDIEKNFLLTLRKKYNNGKLPIILVYTQNLISQTFEKMKNYINDILEKENLEKIDDEEKDINMINVFSKSKIFDNGIMKPAFGLDKLMEFAKKKSNIAIHIAIYNMIQKYGINKAIEFYKNIGNSLFDGVNDFMNKENENDIIKNIFIYCFIQFYNENIELSNECYNFINYISSQIKDFILEKNNINLAQFIEERADFISKELLNIQTKLIYENNQVNINNCLKNIDLWKEEGKTKLKERLLLKSKIYSIRNLAKKLYIDVVENYQNLFIELIEKIIENEEIKNEIIKLIENKKIVNISHQIDGLINDLKIYQKNEKEKAEKLKNDKKKK
jgi:ABC-type dipeptide/oligopeptide/nickel transport system ATPase subunit